MKPRSLLTFAVIASAGWTAEPLRARWGDHDGGLMWVLGLDAAGRVRLVPEDRPEGEALVPPEEARGLRFLLPDDFRRARRMAEAGRAGEAVLLLRQSVPALVPFAGVPESNAGPAVRLYLRLLVRERAWSDALAVWLALDAELAGREYAAESAALARGLQTAQRRDELRLVLDRWWIAPPLVGELESRATAEGMAAELRRDGLWTEAAMLYDKLRVGADADERRRFDLLLAYLDWHRGSDLGAQAVLRVAKAPAADTELGALHRLLAGRLARQVGNLRAALDVLAEALVGAGGAGEWRAELLAVLAATYRENGDGRAAEGIVAHLRRQFPASRWLAEAKEARTL